MHILNKNKQEIRVEVRWNTHTEGFMKFMWNVNRMIFIILTFIFMRYELIEV